MDAEPYGIVSSNEGPSRIKKMALKDSAVVEIIRNESPSSLFVRPKDHIRDSLIYKEPYQLVPAEKFSPGHFVLAPLESRSFGRCVIVSMFEKEDASKVFFIDEAVTATVSNKCLFEIEESQTCIPWQVMHVTIGRMVNLSGNEWSLDQCRDFTNILSNFDYFQITPCQVDLSTDTNRPSLLVNMYGLEDVSDYSKKVSIEQLCAVTMKDVIVSIFPVNMLDDPQLTDLDATDDSDFKNIEPFRLEPPIDWIHECARNNSSEESDWAVENRVPRWNMMELGKYIGSDGCFNCLAEIKELVSPSDMVIYPVHSKNEHETEQWLLNELDQMNFYLRHLNDFYLDMKNQKPFSYDEIKNALEIGQVYAVVQPILTGKWSRCEILELLTINNAAVRFLDTGRKCVQNLRTLFRMHRMHTIHLPFTIECGKAPSENILEGKVATWTEKQCDALKQIVPFDVPLLVGPDMEFLENGKLQIYSLKYPGENVNLFDEIPSPTKEDFEHDWEVNKYNFSRRSQ